MKKLTTGELAELFAISKYKIRHYIDEQLLTPERNQENGYYLFDEADIYKLYQIIVLRNIGYSLSSIKQVFAGSSILNSLKNAELQLQQQIDELTAIKKTVQDIIQAQITYKLDELIFLKKTTRYFKKAPVEILTGNEIDLLKATKAGFTSLDNVSYISSGQSMIPSFEGTKAEHDYLFSQGTYGCKSFIVHNESMLEREIDCFLADPLLNITATPSELLIYENVLCALAYNDVTVYTLEVKL
ncbi:MerR family transcriptional regulator [Enterococcus wangshanyuanii]|uniref:Transcriptional regulator n=1 Tax=Enterococcus wangshanyuanii TaxID=2005703 RepID=A0ABQ1PHI5_9ENTE|nr:MerR family transcriptional regulator [Enterococcus wangshanyuanii]GGC97415.1 transcriptional regulator [Enterococcus wangshanyuanii]